MSYTPTNWATGDTVTAEKLNKMEQGIENAADPFIVMLTPTAQNYSGVMDKTAGELETAYNANRKIVFRMLTGATTFLEGNCSFFEASDNYPMTFYAYILYNNDLMMLRTNSNDTSDNEYAAIHYPLMPAT